MKTRHDSENHPSTVIRIVLWAWIVLALAAWFYQFHALIHAVLNSLTR